MFPKYEPENIRLIPSDDEDDSNFQNCESKLLNFKCHVRKPSPKNVLPTLSRCFKNKINKKTLIYLSLSILFIIFSYFRFNFIFYFLYSSYKDYMTEATLDEFQKMKLPNKIKLDSYKKVLEVDVDLHSIENDQHKDEAKTLLDDDNDFIEQRFQERNHKLKKLL